MNPLLPPLVLEFLYLLAQDLAFADEFGGEAGGAVVNCCRSFRRPRLQVSPSCRRWRIASTHLWLP